MRTASSLFIAAVVVGGASCKPPPAPPADVFIALDDGTECRGGTELVDGGVANVVCAFDFGVVGADGASHAFQIKNAGAGPATVNAVELLGDAAFQVVSSPSSLPAGASDEIEIHVTPASTLRIETQASVSWESPENVIRLALFAGSDQQPQITLEPPSCDLGQVAPGTPLDCPFTIHNTGRDVLVLDSVTTTAGFSLATAVPPATSVLPDATLGLDVIGQAGIPGFVSGDVLIASSDPATPSAVFHVSVTSCVSSGNHCDADTDCCEDPDRTQPRISCVTPDPENDPDVHTCAPPPEPPAGEGEGEGE